MEIFNELCEVDTLHSVNGARIFIDLVSLTFETKTILSRVWLVDFFHVHSEDSLRRSDVGTDFSKNRKNKKEKGDRNKRRGNSIRDYQPSKPSNGKVCSSLENKLSSGGWWNDSEFWDVSTKWSLRSKTSFPLLWTDAPDVAILWCPLSLSLSREDATLFIYFLNASTPAGEQTSANFSRYLAADSNSPSLPPVPVPNSNLSVTQ